jgi:hypothetical protein
MILMFRKAPGRLSRAIVAFAARSGNKIRHAVQAAQINRDRDDDVNCWRPNGSGPSGRRTTITVQTERLWVVRSERRSARLFAESEADPLVPPMETNPERRLRS